MPSFMMTVQVIPALTNTPGGTTPAMVPKSDADLVGRRARGATAGGQGGSA